MVDGSHNLSFLSKPTKTLAEPSLYWLVPSLYQTDVRIHEEWGRGGECCRKVPIPRPVYSDLVKLLQGTLACTTRTGARCVSRGPAPPSRDVPAAGAWRTHFLLGHQVSKSAPLFL